MSWAKVKKRNYPLGWWFHKVLCEIGWVCRNRYWFGWDMYYKHLNKLCKYGYNLYGDKIPGYDKDNRRN